MGPVHEPYGSGAVVVPPDDVATSIAVEVPARRVQRAREVKERAIAEGGALYTLQRCYAVHRSEVDHPVRARDRIGALSKAERSDIEAAVAEEAVGSDPRGIGVVARVAVHHVIARSADQRVATAAAGE